MGDGGADHEYDPDLDLPIKLGPCSNGEYVPPPMSEVEAETIRRTREAADTQARRLGVSRRKFLRSVSGAALMLLTLDATARAARAGAIGGRYLLHPDAAGDLDAARAAIAGKELVFDVQTHYLNYDLAQPGGLGIGMLFPQQRCGESDPRACFSVDHFIEELFLKSDTSMIVVSAIPIPGSGNPLSIDDMELAKKIFTQLCGSGRVLVQGQTFPSIGNAAEQRDAMAKLREEHKIGAWKVYTHAGGPPWWLDDHEAGAAQGGNAFLENVRAVGPKIVAVHKGFGLVGGSARGYASPVDVGPAAKAHPDIKFVVYHSGYEPEDKEGPYTDATADVGVNRLIKTAIENGIGKNGNIYPELGSTWRSVMRDPTQAAHVLGKLLKQFGPDRVVWGTDSIWYGTPQDQIQAFRAFEITSEFQQQFGYPALTQKVKEKVLGTNSTRVYKVKPKKGHCDFTREELEQVRQELPTGARTYGPKTGQQVAALIRAHGWA
ncbi:MAG TPA: amidohydrolase family protein [Acidimicrobiia bacterium]|nr:amidohydrolase family protein [Acidimicrobiia bacterium]